MTKQDIVKEVCKRTGAISNECSTIIDEAFRVMAEEVAKGETITIRGLFTIMPVVRAEKVARNITKGTQIVVPKRVSPKVKFSKEILSAMRKLRVK